MIPISSQLKQRLKRLTPFYKAYKFFFRSKPSVEIIPDYLVKRKDILEVLNIYSKHETFIETGTYFGDTLSMFRDNFKKLISIELSIDLAAKATERFKNDEKIWIHQGNSAEKLISVLTDIDSPCVFWLDGHYSSEFWVGDEYIKTAKGNKNTPIMEELKVIAKHSIQNHVILIDDARLFNGTSDYPDLKKLKSILKRNFPNHNVDVSNDIIKVLPNLHLG